MNFFNSALTMAKSAAEAGLEGVQTISSKVTEATGVEIPVSIQIPTSLGTTTDEKDKAGSSKDAEGKVEAGGEVGEEEEKLGRLECKLDYNYDKNTLSVTVIQCEELPAMDMGGTSDPYVKMYMLPDKKKKFCTKKLKKTLNPVYNETFTFPRIPFNEIANKTIMFDIFDHDALGADDQIGQIKLSLCQIDLAADNIQMWLDIKDPPKFVLGDICVSLRYKPQSKPPVMVIVIVECRNLKQMDLGGASDPYVKVNHMLHSKRVRKYKTTVQPANLNPYWNTTFKIPMSPYELKETELYVYVNDFDKFGSNDSIGYILFSMKDTGTGKQHWVEAISQPKTNVTKWHALQPTDEEK